MAKREPYESPSLIAWDSNFSRLVSGSAPDSGAFPEDPDDP